MNRDQLKGRWMQFKGEVKKQWARLTEDDLKHTEGDVDTLAGRIQERYGTTKEKVKQQLDKIVHRLQGSKERAASEPPASDIEKKRDAA